MRATVGDQLVQHGRVVGQHDKVGEIVEVLGQEGNPPYRVRFQDGHEGLCSPGPDTEIRHRSTQPAAVSQPPTSTQPPGMGL
ncbi:DUF1918 domain-containing protein [Streptomyces glaucescens]|uniref:DUF1918 domain-containing protein n=1 Tax=Streptomyces glaucescens TaxID=1907 RepID=A0A089X8A6_STRGA|nr:DUF1918 domain-containing protein [Streptomyces glaucescens]AIR97324.1 hypothetical protein SGLAU_06540 [Streptomyces glaucescens]